MLRKAKQEDITQINAIAKEGIAYLAKQKVDQWQNGYPNQTVFQQDIALEQLYVYQEEEIIGIAALIAGVEPTYQKIYAGAWLNDAPYLTIHRMSVSQSRKSKDSAMRMMQEIETYCFEQGIKNIRIDTHCDNQPMQRLLKKCGYVCCGEIYLTDGNVRLAFQKILPAVSR